MNTRSIHSEKGFSLLELFIVIAVIGILAAVAVPAYFNYLSRSRQSEVIGELMAMKASQERFFAENGAYAGNLDPLGYTLTAGTYTAGYYQYWIVAATPTGFNTAGTIRALGDLNGDGVFTDGWEVPIQDLMAKPDNYATGGEGFSFSFLGALLD